MPRSQRSRSHRPQEDLRVPCNHPWLACHLCFCCSNPIAIETSVPAESSEAPGTLANWWGTHIAHTNRKYFILAAFPLETSGLLEFKFRPWLCPVHCPRERLSFYGILIFQDSKVHNVTPSLMEYHLFLWWPKRYMCISHFSQIMTMNCHWQCWNFFRSGWYNAK